MSSNKKRGWFALLLFNPPIHTARDHACHANSYKSSRYRQAQVRQLRLAASVLQLNAVTSRYFIVELIPSHFTFYLRFGKVEYEEAIQE